MMPVAGLSECTNSLKGLHTATSICVCDVRGVEQLDNVDMCLDIKSIVGLDESKKCEIGAAIWIRARFIEGLN